MNKAKRALLSIAAVVTSFIVAFVGGVSFLFWHSQQLAQGVERGGWLARDMSGMLNDFPVFTPVGSVIQRYEGRDGERPPTSSLSYPSSTPAEDLLARYRLTFKDMGCTVSNMDKRAIKIDCADLYLSDFSLSIGDGGIVSASWLGGEE